MTSLLSPLGALYGAAARARAAAYGRGWLPRARLAGPVISVGNLSVGGSGKTPVVALLAAMLRDAGRPVAVLSRGYRGSFRGDCLVVADAEGVHAGPEAAGDEPVMLARSLPGVVVAVGRRRDRVGRAVEARYGQRVHVLDDGFQHLRLQRDLDLVCLSAHDLGDRPLPAGRLREPRAALARADLILLDADEAARSALAAKHPGRVLRLRRRVLGFFGLDGAERPAPARPFLLSGIARPERFHDDVSSRVEHVSGTAVFADHHAYRPADVAGAESRAREAGADAIVTTAKDAVRLPPLSVPVLVLRVAAEVDDEVLLRERVLRAAERRRGVR
ncbi:MAG: tetraacyldisaccharide 4'-kinase [Acidobacteria bacterium]|nr:MAG: tetraacyldisaccharide 4'-kinase [Acidobacteriota bacterium]